MPIGLFAAPLPLNLSSTNPLDDATSVSTTIGELNMYFTAAGASLATQTGNITIYRESDGSVFEVIDVTNSSRFQAPAGLGEEFTADIFPLNPFEELTEYYILADSGIVQSSSGNVFGGISDPTIWSFTTNDETPPTIQVFHPLNSVENVAVDTNLTLTFSEAVEAKTGNITLFRASDNSAVETFSVATDITGSGTNTVTITPSTALETSQSYYVKIDATAFDDTAGNSLSGVADETTWNFSTIVVDTSTSQRRSGISNSSRLSASLTQDKDVEDETDTEEMEDEETTVELPKDTASLRALIPSRTFVRDLQMTMTGDDVYELQVFLNENGFALTDEGPGSPGNETNYFGPLTHKAVLAYQNAHKDRILEPFGLTEPTGYVGPLTRFYLNQ